MSFETVQIVLIASIPILAGIIGWITNVVAIIMTFHPIEFIGLWDPWIGWQGIIPRRAIKMATKSVELMTTKLIKVEEVFARVDPKIVAEQLAPVLYGTLEEIIHDVANQHAPGVWIMIPDHIKAEVVIAAQEEIPEAIESMFAEFRVRVNDVLDVKDMVITGLMKDKALLNEIFQRCGKKEFAFIKISGLYFGFLFGLVQMTIFIFYPALWVLPAFGFLVGYATNWIALKMIFRPIDPIIICGVMEFQGLFLKRQQEVSEEYARLVSAEILSARNMLQALVTGPNSDVLAEIVHRHTRRAIDSYAGPSLPLIQMAIGHEQYTQIKQSISQRLLSRMPSLVLHLEDYTERALDIENTLKDKMSALPSKEFEDLLHPVFQEDEIILILVGAALGALIGLGQATLQYWTTPHGDRPF